MEIKRYILVKVNGIKRIVDTKKSEYLHVSNEILKTSDNVFDLLEIGDEYVTDNGYKIEITKKEHLNLAGVLAFTGIKKLYKLQLKDFVDVNSDHVGNKYYTEFIVEKDNIGSEGKQGICPVCGSVLNDYDSIIIDGTDAGYPWTCDKCDSRGVEWYDLVYSEQVVRHNGQNDEDDNKENEDEE